MGHRNCSNLSVGEWSCGKLSKDKLTHGRFLVDKLNHGKLQVGQLYVSVQCASVVHKIMVSFQLADKSRQASSEPAQSW